MTTSSVESIAGRTWTREAVEAVGTGVLVIDDDGRILLANPRAASILKRTASELRGSSIESVLAPLETLTAANHGLERPQIVLKLPDGEQLDVGFSITSFAPRGDVDGRHHHVCLFQDISEPMRLREERDRLLQFAGLGTVMPSLLHELTNPLAAIQATVELLIEEIDQTEPRIDLQRVLREIQRIKLIAHRMRGLEDVGRPLRGSQQVDIESVIEDACRLLEPSAEAAGASITLRLGGLTPVALEPAVVRSVVLNLLSNAIDACSAGGEVIVKASCWGPLFELIVKDTGSGMAPEVLARCTEVFFTTKRRASGLGLALCKQVAEAATGTLRIDSRQGHGTRVTLTVPLTPSSTTQPPVRD